jgi:SlyX protein
MSDIKQADTEALLIELQTQLAFQEQTIYALNEALLGQQQQLDSLRLEIAMLRDGLEDVLESREAQPGNEKPPHY